MLRGPIRFTNALAGTVDFIYPGPAIDMQSPAAAGAANGATYIYYAQSLDMSQWEIGSGAYTSSSGTFARTTISSNSLGTTAKINFTNPPQILVLDSLLPGVIKKNYVINGGMQVSQENGTTAGTTAAYFPADQFSVGALLNTTGTLSIAQVASLTPGGSPNRVRFTVTAADASAVPAGRNINLIHPLEGLRVADLRAGTATAKTITVQFGVHAPAGTYCLSLRNGATNRSYVAEYVIAAGEANTDVVKSATFTLDTTGTWPTDNTAAFWLGWSLSTGSTLQTAPNIWTAGNFQATSNQFNFMATNGAVFELFDVGLYEGAVAPAFQLPDFPTELALCMRYWEKSYDYTSLPGSTGSGLQSAEALFFDGLTAATHQTGGLLKFKARKRAAATVTIYSYLTGAAGKIADATTGADITATSDSLGENGARVYSTSTGTSSAIARYYHWTANARL